ncbi:MAG: metallophosphoesterase [Bauldia sp.]|nr:metallophosphoesterase [Bauldia sp.]
MWLGEAKTPEGMRLYAIGDVHGCDGLLAEAHAAIASDLAASPVADHRIIHVGDYVDRGPDSAGVVARLAAFAGRDSRVVCLIGNHDRMLLDFLTDPHDAGPLWLMNGGDATLRSYGLDAAKSEPWHRLRELADRFAEALPLADRAFLEALPFHRQFGDFFFCHAGIRPGVPLDAQSEEDLIWIREPFLLDPADHGVVVVHGHTPRAIPEIMPNRIGIDTGAVFGGPLTVLALEGTGYRFL